MKNQTNLESMIQERIDELKSVPARNPQIAARARARFLAEARSARESRRQTGWGFFFRKQQFAMNVIVTLLVIAGLFVGGGTTVKAAQDDLPNEPLYIVKTWSENVSLQLEKDPAAKADRLMQLAGTRIQEMSQLLEAGQTPPERVRLRLEQHIQQTLQICGNMDDADLDQKLTQLQGQLKKYEQDIQLLQAQAPQGEQPVLEHTRTMLQTQLQVVAAGLTNHEAFRDTVNNGSHPEQPETTPVVMPSVTPHEEQVDQATPQPGNQENGNGLGPDTNPSGQNAHVTPTPKNGNNGVNSGDNPGNKDKDKVKDEKENGADNKGKNPK